MARRHVGKLKPAANEKCILTDESIADPRCALQKKERSGLQSACDELIDKGAIHHRRIVGYMPPELGEFIQ
jgi:hypothetical protein